MLRPSLDQSRPVAAAEAARLYVLAVIYAALGAIAWLAAGRRIARPRKEI